MGLGEVLLGGHRHGQEQGAGDPADGVIHAPRIYEAFCAVAFLGRRGAAYRRIAAATGARPGERVLDIGCGTGALTRALAAAVGPDGSVMGIDPGEEMLAHARARGPRQVTYTRMSAERLDFPDGQFDRVAGMLVWHHLPEDARAATLGEARRVLRPGGRLTVAEFAPPQGPVAQRLVGALTGPAMQTDRLAEIQRLMAAAGFRDVRRVPLGHLLGAVVGVAG